MRPPERDHGARGPRTGKHPRGRAEAPRTARERRRGPRTRGPRGRPRARPATPKPISPPTTPNRARDFGSLEFLPVKCFNNSYEYHPYPYVYPCVCIVMSKRGAKIFPPGGRAPPRSGGRSPGNAPPPLSQTAPRHGGPADRAQFSATAGKSENEKFRPHRHGPRAFDDLGGISIFCRVVL